MSQDCLNVSFFGGCRRLSVSPRVFHDPDSNSCPASQSSTLPHFFLCFFCIGELIFLKRAQTSRCLDPSGNRAVAMAAVQSTKGDEHRREGTKGAAEKETADPDDGSSRCAVAHPCVGLVEERTSDTTHLSFPKQIRTCGHIK